MTIIESLLSADKQREYREHYITRHTWNGKVPRFLEYYDGPRFQQQLSGLIDGTWKFSVPTKKYKNVKRYYFVYSNDELLLMGYLNYVLHQAVEGMLADVYSRSGTPGPDWYIPRHLEAADTPGAVILKGDIRNFSNSIRRDVFLRVQERVLADDSQGLELVKRIFESGCYSENGEIKSTPLHLFMGTPLDSYSNNTVLYEMDCLCRERSLSYIRFYDDFALVLPSRADAEKTLRDIEEMLSALQLHLHPLKTNIVEAGECYELLGLSIRGKEVDISPDTIGNCAKSLRPYFRNLVKQVRCGHLKGDEAMVQAIRILEACTESSYFKSEIISLFHCITTDAGAKRLNCIIADWIRAIGVGTTSGAKYRISYRKLKALGYKSIFNWVK